MEDNEHLLFYIAACNCEFTWKISDTPYEDAYDEVCRLGSDAVKEGLIQEGDEYGCETAFCPCANCWLHWFEENDIFFQSSETGSNAPGHGGEVYYDYFIEDPEEVEQDLLDAINHRGERLKKLMDELRKEQIN